MHVYCSVTVICYLLLFSEGLFILCLLHPWSHVEYHYLPLKWFFKGSLVQIVAISRTMNTHRTIWMHKLFFVLLYIQRCLRLYIQVSSMIKYLTYNVRWDQKGSWHRTHYTYTNTNTYTNTHIIIQKYMHLNP